jgi:hypothetical protein
MSNKGFIFDPVARTLTFADGDRAALVAPGGTLIGLLPTEFTLTDQDAVFPDATKDRMFVHQWSLQYAAENWYATETGLCLVTALPQEWSLTTVLGDAPDGTDIFTAQVRLTQTVAPSHNWLGIPIAKLVPEGVWISLTGSLSLEANFGMCRAMSIYIDNDPMSATYRKLVLFQQQSVATAPGGYGLHGGTPGGEPGAVGSPPAPGQNFQTGGETLYNSAPGWPVYQGPNSAPQYKNRGAPADTGPFSADVSQLYRKSGSQPPSISDPTNYSSTWSFDLRGQFGRRS